MITFSKNHFVLLLHFFPDELLNVFYQAVGVKHEADELQNSLLITPQSSSIYNECE